MFPQEIAKPPREWAERSWDVRRWEQMPRGGHFAALEEPELLAHEVREFLPAVPRLGRRDILGSNAGANGQSPPNDCQVQRVRNLMILGLTSSGRSWCMKWPVPGMMTFSSPPEK